MNSENRERRILVVDDDKDIRTIVLKTLQSQGYQTFEAESGKAALAAIDSIFPHLVLLDVSMPGIDGMETLKQLRNRDNYVSVVFVSAQSSKEDVIRGLDAGADDYLCKPFDVWELLARIRAQLRIKDLNDRLKKANERLKELVDIDDLTGLFNMRSLYKKLDYELDRARRHDRSIAVLMMDVDHFKLVNDNHDHLFGSWVLSQIGRMVRENIRKIDFAARYGGDEYLVVLSEISVEGASTFGNRLREKIEKTIFQHENYSVTVTASLGLAVANPNKHAVDARALVRYADKALYQAKEGGRNRVEVFDFENDYEEE
jgi:two-component system, cell cycle response regulator